MKQFILLVLILISFSHAFASDILTRFWADKDYVRPIGLKGQPVAETYVFYSGSYYPSAYEEEGEVITFETVASTLIGELKKQNYQMTQEPRDADYILMVNWGQTNPEAETEEVTYGIYSGDKDQDYDEITVDVVPEKKQRENANLLGASKLYSMSRISLKKRQLEEAVGQDRYFINIFAISIEDLKTRTEVSDKIKPRWECQLSVPTGGINDKKAAFAAMARIGSDYFGQNISDITFIDEQSSMSVVTMGELEFLVDTGSDSDRAELDASE